VGSHSQEKVAYHLRVEERRGTTTTNTDSLGSALEGAVEHHLDRSDFGQVKGKGITHQLTAGGGLWVAKAIKLSSYRSDVDRSDVAP
jgi:hypothetical protein